MPEPQDRAELQDIPAQYAEFQLPGEPSVIQARPRSRG